MSWRLPGQATLGGVSVVSSADIYEFDADGLITQITAYAVELQP